MANAYNFTYYSRRMSMSLPLRHYPRSAQNSRVEGLPEKAQEAINEQESDIFIEKCYRQIFFHITSRDREFYLESQLRNKSITVRDFVRGLFLSDRFRRGYIECNNNCRLVEQVLARALGRNAYNEQEKLALSILIAERGFISFIDFILNCEEYMTKFGYDIPPAQSTRVLPGKQSGDVPLYQKYPRYGLNWQEKLIANKLIMSISDHLRYSKTTSLEKFLYSKPTGMTLKIWILTLSITIPGIAWISILILRTTISIN